MNGSFKQDVMNQLEIKFLFRISINLSIDFFLYFNNYDSLLSFIDETSLVLIDEALCS